MHVPSPLSAVRVDGEMRNSFTRAHLFWPKLRTAFSSFAPVGSTYLKSCPDVQRLFCLFVIGFSPDLLCLLFLLLMPGSAFSPLHRTKVQSAQACLRFNRHVGRLEPGFPRTGKETELRMRTDFL